MKMLQIFVYLFVNRQLDNFHPTLPNGQPPYPVQLIPWKGRYPDILQEPDSPYVSAVSNPLQGYFAQPFAHPCLCIGVGQLSF